MYSVHVGVGGLIAAPDKRLTVEPVPSTPAVVQDAIGERRRHDEPFAVPLEDGVLSVREHRGAFVRR
jgi:hypothetical protein